MYKMQFWNSFKEINKIKGQEKLAERLSILENLTAEGCEITVLSNKLKENISRSNKNNKDCGNIETVKVYLLLKDTLVKQKEIRHQEGVIKKLILKSERIKSALNVLMLNVIFGERFQ